MKPISYLLALAFAGLFACSSEPEIPIPLPPSEWIVVGNDRGLRNEFIDMANVVRLRDSSLTVYPLGSPNIELDYPVIDSVLHGGDERWRIIPHNQDSIILFDSLKNNNYYLRRLVARDSLPNSLVVGRDFSSDLSRGDWSYLFENSPGTDQNCYLSRGYWTFSGFKRVSFGKDGYWRIDHRFRQPLLFMTTGNIQHTVILIDSAFMDTGLSGVVVNNNMPNGRERRQRFIPSTDEYERETIADMLGRLDSEGTVSRSLPVPDSMLHYSIRFTSSGRELREWRSMNDFEAENLRLSIAGNRYRFHTPEQTLFEGEVVLLPTAPYLMIDGGCVDQNYLPVHAAGIDTLVVTVPLRVVITKPMEERTTYRNGKAVTLNPGQNYTETEIELRIPTLR